MVQIPHSSYFEGILQLRNPTDELIEWVHATVVQDDRAMVTKEKKVRGGVDLYLSSQKYLQILGKKLKENFAGEYNLSATLHTQRKDGKKLYRITILFRLYPFNVGDTVEVEGDEVMVLRIENNQVQVQDVASKRKFRVPPEKISPSR